MEGNLRQARGFEQIDTMDYLVLIQAPMQQVGEALSQVDEVIEWQRDIYQSEILVSSYSVIIFQLEGHHWTTLIELSNPNRRFTYHLEPMTDEFASVLSETLNTKAIVFTISDSSSDVGYHLYSNGQSTERYYYSGDSEEDTDEVEDDDDDVDDDLGWMSDDIDVADDLDEGPSPRWIVSNFLREQDAFALCFFEGRTRKIGQRFLIVKRGVERSAFVRVDHLVLRPATSTPNHQTPNQ
jgi:hypothetical protein